MPRIHQDRIWDGVQMGIMRKLLNQTLVYYAILSLLMLLLATPFFYWLSKVMHYNDVDEGIRLREKEFFQEKKWQSLTPSEIQKWNEYNRDIKILPDTITVSKEHILDQVFYDELDQEWEPYRVLYRDLTLNGNRNILMIRLNLIEKEDLWKASAILLTSIFIFLLGGFLLITKWVSSRLWAPFYQSLEIIYGFDIEKKELPFFPTSRTLEFVQLQQALEKLITHTLNAFEREKEFTQNASHELQTPLAIFQSKLDLLLQSPGLSESQAAILQQLYDASARLLRLNKKLLLLAKIENNQYLDKVELNINNMVLEVMDYFSEQGEEKKLKMRIIPSEGLFVFANRGLTEILINNLFLNAIQHNVPFGEIRISFGKNSLIIQNSGQSEPLDPEKIFRRFSKSSPTDRGTGLGLAIVKKIADLNAWKIKYEYVQNLHSFSISFPVDFAVPDGE